MDNEKVDIITEEHEELPTNAEKITKMVTVPVFGEEDKNRIISMLKKLDRLFEIIESDESLKMLGEVKDSLNVLLSNIRSNEAKIVSFLGRAIDNIEQINNSTSAIRGHLAKLEDRINLLEGTASRISDSAENKHKVG